MRRAGSGHMLEYRMEMSRDLVEILEAHQSDEPLGLVATKALAFIKVARVG
jgi:hypothetical protein